ncbi:MAG TPA: M3 family oligoendopeptidase [Actinomycetota bacterium]|nr:M3 family oligoendopeptidase [Actinomycetota bacterium]
MLTGAEQVRWNLDDIYRGPDDPNFESDVQAAISGAKQFRDRYHGKVAELDAAGLHEAVVELERLSALLMRPSVYSMLRFATDTADPARGALRQRLLEQSTILSAETLFFALEWMALEDEHAERLLTDPVLDSYRHYLRAQRRYRPYVLSEAEERILAEKAPTSQSSWARLFEELTADIHPVLDGQPFLWEQAMAMLQQPDRDLRRRAAEAITAALEPGLRTRAFILNTILLDHATNDRLHGYPNWLSSMNLYNEASDEAVQALVDAVTSRYDIPRRYYALKARLLGLDRLADYDRMAPVSQDSTTMSWEEARSLVEDAYKSFSPAAGEIIKTFFDKSWIDAAPESTKMTGAFCMTTIPDCHPYVLLSYTGERRSVLTLAHELGHGLHGYLSGDQTLFNAETPLTLAETASVFGEALTFGRLLGAETEPKKRLDLLVGRLDDSVATVFRQIAFNRFEDVLHTARREQGELSVDAISKMWFNTQNDVLGDSVEITDGYRIWWSYIPHFIRTPGYVYAYAFGFLFSLGIYQRFLKEGDSLIEPYLKLLRAGGSEAPEELAKLVGLDLSNPSFWSEGLDALDALLVEAEELSGQVEPVSRSKDAGEGSHG